MFFKGLRAARNREHLLWHLQQMASLEQSRADWEHDGRKERVLSTNFELVSHATRALVNFRKLEELDPQQAEAGRLWFQMRFEGENLRDYLLETASLPAIPYHARLSTPRDEVDQLFWAYRKHRNEKC